MNALFHDHQKYSSSRRMPVAGTVEVKVVRDSDLAKQIGNDVVFDLLDYHKVQTLCTMRWDMPFKELQLRVEQEMGVPLGNQRYWFWSFRQNGTYRPFCHMMMQQQDQSTLKDIYCMVRGVQNPEEVDVGRLTQRKRTPGVLNMYLEEDSVAVPRPLPTINQNDILLFFKVIRKGNTLNIKPTSGPRRGVGKQRYVGTDPLLS